MPKGCVWPLNYCRPCGAPAQAGRLCAAHMQRLQTKIGTRDCAWPGCPRRASDRRGLCSFHWKVAFRLIEP